MWNGIHTVKSWEIFFPGPISTMLLPLLFLRGLQLPGSPKWFLPLKPWSHSSLFKHIRCHAFSHVKATIRSEHWVHVFQTGGIMVENQIAKRIPRPSTLNWNPCLPLPGQNLPKLALVQYSTCINLKAICRQTSSVLLCYDGFAATVIPLISSAWPIAISWPILKLPVWLICAAPPYVQKESELGWHSFREDGGQEFNLLTLLPDGFFPPPVNSKSFFCF